MTARVSAQMVKDKMFGEFFINVKNPVCHVCILVSIIETLETSTALQMAIESSTTVEGAEKANDGAKTYSDSDRMVEGGNSRTRKVVDHMVLFRMKDDLTEEQEKEMLESLFTIQYQVKGIISLSVGRVAKKTAEGVTHALFQRFSTKEDLDQYMQNPQRWRIARELVIPFYHGLVMLDFETEVEDEMEAIFRRGHAFSEGIDHAVLLKVKEGTGQASIDHMLQSFRALGKELSSAIIQLTAGTNVSSVGKGYTHGFVARVPSEAALDYLIKHPAYIEALSVDVLPDGTEFISADLPVASSGPSVTLHG